MTEKNQAFPLKEESKDKVLHISNHGSSNNFGYYWFKLTNGLKNLKVLNLILIAFLVGSLGVGVMAVQQQQDIREEAASYNASLEFPSSGSVEMGEEVSVPVMLLTDKAAVMSVNIAIKFDTRHLRLIDIVTFPDTSNFDRYQPLVNGDFDKHGVLLTANNSGVVSFKVDSSHGTVFKGVRGINNPLAILEFEGKEKTKEPVKIKYITHNGASMVVAPSNGENILQRTSEMLLTVK